MVEEQKAQWEKNIINCSTDIEICHCGWPEKLDNLPTLTQPPESPQTGVLWAGF